MSSAEGFPLEALPHDGPAGAPEQVNAASLRAAISLQARLALTIGLLAALMFAIGALGLAGGYRVDRANQDTYENKLAATIQIGNAELLIARTRLVLGGAMAHLGEANTNANEQIRHAVEFFRQSDDAWRRFVEQPHEPGEVSLVLAATQRRDAMRGAMTAFIDALKANDRATANQIGTSQLSPLFNDMTAANEALKRTLFADAKRSYERAEWYFRAFVSLSLAMIALGVLVAAASWITLRRAIMRPLGEALAHFEAIAAGDLSRPIESRRADEMGRLLQGLQAMQARLATTVAVVRGSCRSIGIATREIAAGTLDLSARTEEQAASLEQTAAGMSELTATVRQNAEHAQQAQALATEASAAAANGGGVIDRMTATMSRIDVASRKIAEITGIIEGIAFQTNILSLNAAVEAARAGEHGRGFAVVATEVRALAQHSSAAAKQIGELIADSVSAVTAGSGLAVDAGSAMHEVGAAVQRFATTMNGIVIAADAQRSRIEQVGKEIDRMDSITQQNAALVEQASAAAQELDRQSQELGQQVAVFKVT
jgi:methyl-accepting chemotaxis protein-1 (serine sensor receptor)